MQQWAAAELRHARLGDQRLNRRLVRIVEDLAAQPTASVPQASGTWAATKAVYRFWDSESVTPEAIRASHRQSTVARVAGEALVLAVQDTTDLDFAHHPATQGLGPLENQHQAGLKVHSVLAVNAEGVPLGLLHQAVWVRDPARVGQRHQRRKLPTADKESQRWLTALAASQEAVPELVSVITVADSEADIYDLFALPRRAGSALLIRGTHDRRVEKIGYVWETVRQSPLRGVYRLEVRRKEDQPARQATLSVRYLTLAVQPPRHHLKQAEVQPIQLTAILVAEEAPPAGATPITWLLWTSLPITDLDAALRCVRWYSYRWLIERYHFVLKSGCRLEDLQLAEAERIQRALATYCIVAWRLLWLTYEARRSPDTPCDRVLEPAEWQSLYGRMHQTSRPPATPPTLRQAVRWIAQLGGFLGRKSDGEPGVQTIWLGLRRLADIAAMWQLLLPPPAPTVISFSPQRGCATVW
jgi:hypothetical protein